MVVSEGIVASPRRKSKRARLRPLESRLADRAEPEQFPGAIVSAEEGTGWASVLLRRGPARPDSPCGGGVRQSQWAEAEK
ncbi:hypothetical protein [Thermogemmata fonticola]|uniref:Uncharacterized protein n=1 Tax=Thermogemmata fonticola TaxID=2755323 RepID=A0A7V9ABZ1_9BACT|nr:hypothetical protein [Thermogemmata fonticola]MBA2226252.1 hypothetical protein [Thermogemmata fonticola]